MEAKDRDILKSVLEKRRNCVPLSKEEQAWVDNTFNKLFEKKFGNRVFSVSTGEDIRKAAGVDKKKVGAQSDGPIAKERSAFGKPQKIEDDDSSGAVKATEDGEYVDTDEKNEGGEAEHTNASDITHADNDDLQRKPVAKFGYGDVVVKEISGRAFAGIIVKLYEKQSIALVKWSNGTFSNVHLSTLEKVADKAAEERAKVNPPIAKPADDKDKDDGMPANSIETEADVEKAESADCADCADCVGKPEEEKCEACRAADVEKAEPWETCDGCEEEAEAPKDGAKEEVKEVVKEYDESKETPAEEAAETPEEQAAEEAAGTEHHDAPTEGELAENEWENTVKALVLKNSAVENAGAIVGYFKANVANVAKSGGDGIAMPLEEVRKSNPKLAAVMEKKGYKSINLGKGKKDKGSLPMTLGVHG